MKKPKKSWKITGQQVAPMPYNAMGQELTFYLEQIPESSQPTIFISAYCHDKGDAAFIEKTAKEIERRLNV
jgi:hypothetical protein